MRKKTKQHEQAQKYLASRGYDYERLSKEQQDVLSNFLRGKWMLNFSLFLFALSFVVLAYSTYKGYGRIDTRFVNSSDVIFYAIIAEDYEQIIEPNQARKIADNIVENSKVNGVRMGTAFFLAAVMITAIVQYRDKRKTIEAFFPDKRDTENDHISGD
jgi:hypothetical protein